MTGKSTEQFNVEEWLKTIDIWDKKYDYVMHDDHWLISKYDPGCEKCRQSVSEDLIDLNNETFDLYRSAIAETPKPPHHRPIKTTETKQHHHQLLEQTLVQQQPPQQQQQQLPQQQGITSRIPKFPVRLSHQF